MRRIILLVVVALVMAAMLIASALPVFAAASDNASCVGEAFSEAPPGTKGEVASTAATGNEPGYVADRVSTFGPQKENCLAL